MKRSLTVAYILILLIMYLRYIYLSRSKRIVRYRTCTFISNETATEMKTMGFIDTIVSVDFFSSKHLYKLNAGDIVFVPLLCDSTRRNILGN